MKEEQERKGKTQNGPYGGKGHKGGGKDKNNGKGSAKSSKGSDVNGKGKGNYKDTKGKGKKEDPDPDPERANLSYSNDPHLVFGNNKHVWAGTVLWVQHRGVNRIPYDDGGNELPGEEIHYTKTFGGIKSNCKEIFFTGGPLDFFIETGTRVNFIVEPNKNGKGVIARILNLII